MCGVPPLSGLVWVVVGCVRVVDALSLFCGAFCVVALWSLGVREAPLRLALFYLGIAQMAIAPPPTPPALKRALWGTFFRADLSDFVKSLF